MTISFEQFLTKFNFDEKNHLFVGVEREGFITRGGKVVPESKSVLDYLHSKCNGRSQCFCYEFSACQLEDKTPQPCDIRELRKFLFENEKDLNAVEQALGIKRLYCGVGPEDMPLDHYSCERYDQIASQMTPEVRSAACRTTGVHIHVGMKNHKTALEVYNSVIKFFPMLCRLGCVYFDGRQDQYQIVVEGSGKNSLYSKRLVLFAEHLRGGIYIPPVYKDWNEFYQRAVCEGFAENPRNLWDFIRISRHGTIEFRIFDSTEDIELIEFWALICKNLCERYCYN